MNDDTQEASPETHSGPFIPMVLLSLAVSFFFLFQVSRMMDERSQLNGQLEKAVKNLDMLLSGVRPPSTGNAEYDDAIRQFESPLQQVRVYQNGVESVVRPLLELAGSGDADAKSIVEKYKIKVTPPAPAPGQAPAPAPTATPAPAALR